MIDLRGLTLDETIAAVEGLGYERYRGIQLFEWVHRRGVSDLGAISNLPKGFLADLTAEYGIAGAAIEKKLTSGDGKTRKYLFRLSDSVIIESVLMKQRYGTTVCVSCQAGCDMACVFCASARGGKRRDLTAGEMASQVYAAAADSGERVGNVVLMGMGEPLDNYEECVRFIRILNEEKGANISQRNITLSTCGIVGGMRRLMGEGLNVTLAVSLHAPNDDVRRRLMPVAKRYAIDDVIAAARDYGQHTKRRVTFEYALIDGLNDGYNHAEELAGRVKGGLFHVNVIPLNDAGGGSLKGAKPDAAARFVGRLRRLGVEATLRTERGADVAGACGQLKMNADTGAGSIVKQI